MLTSSHLEEALFKMLLALVRLTPSRGLPFMVRILSPTRILPSRLTAPLLTTLFTTIELDLSSTVRFIPGV